MKHQCNDPWNKRSLALQKHEWAFSPHCILSPYIIPPEETCILKSETQNGQRLLRPIIYHCQGESYLTQGPTGQGHQHVKAIYLPLVLYFDFAYTVLCMSIKPYI